MVVVQSKRKKKSDAWEGEIEVRRTIGLWSQVEVETIGTTFREKKRAPPVREEEHSWGYLGEPRGEASGGRDGKVIGTLMNNRLEDTASQGEKKSGGGEGNERTQARWVETVKRKGWRCGKRISDVGRRSRESEKREAEKSLGGRKGSAKKKGKKFLENPKKKRKGREEKEKKKETCKQVLLGGEKDGSGGLPLSSRKEHNGGWD